MKKNVLGVLAHVDSGKTTLSEAMMYLSGSIRNFGRVDHGTAFLDTFEMERKRGITIFSKQAVLTYGDYRTTLLDTPGHTDFSAEMERTLDVIDTAILVISGPDRVQSHTITVWRLLRQRNIPTIVFVNKMDMAVASGVGSKSGSSAEKIGLSEAEAEILKELRKDLGEGFYSIESPDFEAMAMGDEALLEEFFETEAISKESELAAFRQGKIFPCRFGAALRLEGVEAFLADLAYYSPDASDSAAREGEFGARVYKISRDEKNVRLTHARITSGRLKIRDVIKGKDWEAKVTGIRVYSGAGYTNVEEAEAGDVVAITGLNLTYPGLGLGCESTEGGRQELEPVLTYSVLLPEGADITLALRFFRELEEEEPTLKVAYDERTGDIRVSLMGPIQLEILRQQVEDRFGLSVDFGPGTILYRETITTSVEGVGHYEPLRHYAEVHLLLEPAERGSGVTISTSVSEDRLDRNWQRLILTHLYEKDHLGVLTGSPITDINITLVAGRAHNKHTEGGDFRQATYRAVRQGLMQTENILLEPYYSFSIEVPTENTGRALTDLQNMGCVTNEGDGGIISLGDSTLIEGRGPVKQLQNYPEAVQAYTHGLGKVSFAFYGYEEAADASEVIEALGYEAERDVENPADSIFCSHGAGVNIKWDEVPLHMHLPFVYEEEAEEEATEVKAARYVAAAASDEELLRIFERTYGPIKRNRVFSMEASRRTRAGAGSGKNGSGRGLAGAGGARKGNFAEGDTGGNPVMTKQREIWLKSTKAKKKKGPEYLLVDGYNIIFSWEDLKKTAAGGLDAARLNLIDRLRNYQGFLDSPVIVVFDAYKVKGNAGSVEKYGDFSVVYTKEAETADNYIERVTHEIGKKHPVRVATSDGLEQVIVMSHGALRISAREFEDEVKEAERAIREFIEG